jgi:hypothetical protein
MLPPLCQPFNKPVELAARLVDILDQFQPTLEVAFWYSRYPHPISKMMLIVLGKLIRSWKNRKIKNATELANFWGRRKPENIASVIDYQRRKTFAR